MTAAKRAKVAERHVGGKTPGVRVPKGVVEMTTNGGGESSGILQAMWAKKEKNIQVGKGGWEGKSRAERGGDQNGILKVRVKLLCSLMAYFPLTLEHSLRKGKRKIQATANVNEQGCEKQKGTDI